MGGAVKKTINLGKRAVIELNRMILEVNQLVPKTPSTAIPRPIPKKVSKLRIQPRGRSASRATAKKTPNPKTIPLILGRLMITSYVAHRLTSTIKASNSNAPFRGVNGRAESGRRKAERCPCPSVLTWRLAAPCSLLTTNQCSSHNAGTTSIARLRLDDGNSRNGAASASSTQCQRSQKIAAPRRATVTRFNLRLFKISKSYRHYKPARIVLVRH